WILVQQRLDITVFFDYNFATYETGFGDQTNFWIGLMKIYDLTKNKNYKIRFEMQSVNSNWYSADYSYFYLDPPSTGYVLQLGTYIGDAGDAIRLAAPKGAVVGYPFYTSETTPANCRSSTNGGWWVNYCTMSNLN
ncbi:hypothetical protein HELRODRAFT_144922, partial [Helobdella robusta]|uniref:Fibrinogen C-terminal domain-containing protein n=1 Tax=Helobdella robusta TaxID=6412 RepID=T1EJH1_HELRO